MDSQPVRTCGAACAALAMLSTLTTSLAAPAQEPPINLRLAVGTADSVQSSQLLLQLLGIRLLTQRSASGDAQNPLQPQVTAQRPRPECLAPHRPDQ